MTSTTLTILIESEDQTIALGRALADHLRAGDLVALHGTLGMGKSVLARAIVQASCPDANEVPSPTFTLMQLYTSKAGHPVWHMDLYRLTESDEIWELGWDEAGSALVLMEWPDRMGPYMPDARLDILLEHGEGATARKVTLTANGGFACEWFSDLHVGLQTQGGIDTVSQTRLKGQSKTKNSEGNADPMAAAEQMTENLNSPANSIDDPGAGLLKRPVAERIPMVCDASSRCYERIVFKAGEPITAVLMDARTEPQSLKGFAHISSILNRCGIAVPAIYATKPDEGVALIEDFGDDLFGGLIDRGADPEPLLKLGVDVLTRLHHSFSRDLAGPVPVYDAGLLAGQSRWAIEYWLKDKVETPIDVNDLGDKLEAALRPVLARSFAALPGSLLLRDYHADNLIRRPDQTGVAQAGVIDFQDAGLGPVLYDLISLLEDARRDYSDDLRARMIARYLTACPINPDLVPGAWAAIAAQRHLRVLGVFHRLKSIGRDEYMHHCPRVEALLLRHLSHPALAPVKSVLAEGGLKL
ncbi:MAG: hypothetical protein Alpg2KO_17910 [Alphaproteobacteria bacterium]